MLPEEALANYIAGGMNPSEREQFEQQVLSDPEALKTLIAQRQMDAALTALLDPDQQRVEAAILLSIQGMSEEAMVKKVLVQTVRAGKIRRPAGKSSSGWNPPVSWMPRFVLAMTALVCAALFYWWNQNQAIEKKVAGNPVAMLRSQVGARWAANQKALFPGDLVRPGEFEIEAGMAEIVFQNGAILVVEGPSRFKVANVGLVILDEGKVAAEVPRTASGFTVETAAVRVIDHGTRFGVKTVSGGTTEAHVFEGRVDVVPGANTEGPRQELSRDMAVAIDPKAGSISMIKSDPSQFPETPRVVDGLLAGDDFELGTNVSTRGMPATPGLWGGDRAEIIETLAGVVPHTGNGMVRFMRPDALGNNYPEKGEASEKVQWVDLRPYQTAIARGGVVAEASAWFNRVPGDARAPSTFVLTLGSLKGPEGDVKEVLAHRTDAPIPSSQKSVDTDNDPATWEPVEVKMPLPADTQFLMVSIRALKKNISGGDEEKFMGHFADSIALRLSIPASLASGAH